MTSNYKKAKNARGRANRKARGVKSPSQAKNDTKYWEIQDRKKRHIANDEAQIKHEIDQQRKNVEWQKRIAS